MVLATIIPAGIGLLFLIVAFILDFSSAAESNKQNNTAARNFALAAAWLTIIGLILVIIALTISIISFFVAQSELAKEAAKEVGKALPAALLAA